jgi:hypothetical protein
MALFGTVAHGLVLFGPDRAVVVSSPVALAVRLVYGGPVMPQAVEVVSPMFNVCLATLCASYWFDTGTPVFIGWHAPCPTCGSTSCGCQG